MGGVSTRQGHVAVVPLAAVAGKATRARRIRLRSQRSQRWQFPASTTALSRGAQAQPSGTPVTTHATDNTSPRSRRSGGLRPPCSGPVRPEHRPAAASRRQACIASLSLRSSQRTRRLRQPATAEQSRLMSRRPRNSGRRGAAVGMPSRPIVLRTDFSWQCAHKLLQSSGPELVPNRSPRISLTLLVIAAAHRSGLLMVKSRCELLHTRIGTPVG